MSDEATRLLQELESQWRREGAPVAGLLAPGLSDAQIDELVEPLGIVLPEELRVWWRWHNGLAEKPDEHQRGSIGPGDWHPMSLREARDRYLQEPHRKDWPDGDLYWRDAWFPFANLSNDVLFVDTSRIDPRGDAAPVRIRKWFGWEGYDVDIAPSLAVVLATWVRALREGYYWWDRDEGVWHDRIAEAPIDLIETRLIG